MLRDLGARAGNGNSVKTRFVDLAKGSPRVFLASSQSRVWLELIWNLFLA